MIVEGDGIADGVIILRPAFAWFAHGFAHTFAKANADRSRGLRLYNGRENFHAARDFNAEIEDDACRFSVARREYAGRLRFFEHGLSRLSG